MRRLSAIAILLAACAEPASTSAPMRDDLAVSDYQVLVNAGRAAPIEFDVGPDAGSVLIEVHGTMGRFTVASLVTPGGEDVAADGKFVTRSAHSVDASVDWLYPNDPTQTIAPGHYRLEIGVGTRGGVPITDGLLDVAIYQVAAKSMPSCGLHLDFLVDSDAVASADFVDAVDIMVARIDRIYRQIGVEIEDYQVQQIKLSAPDIDVGSGSALSVIDDVLAQARAGGAARDASLHILIARKVGGHENLKFDPAGYSMGLPGPYDADRPTAAVIVSTEAYAFGGLLDAEDMATSLAHEIGHFLGLHHTSEINGKHHDLIPDTPECSDGACSEDFRRNIMTSGKQTTPGHRTRFTAQQGEVVRRHPLCEPMAVEVLPEPLPPGELPACDAECSGAQICAFLDDTATCATACDPDGASPCATGTCAPDDRGTFICH